ncbi:MAG: putative signal-transduction protein containing cAMP-binding and domain [Fibrobacteres bacterium]|nr:putative signal-transduction protein containing cAMP-binding and domain [Fibrobacterota bacterium]
MRVQEVMTDHPVCCMPDSPVPLVARLMAENGCGAIPVIADNGDKRPIGIITDRDIAVRTVARGLNPLAMSAADIITGEPGIVGEDATLPECAEILRQRKAETGTGVLVVTDARGWVSGLVSESQIAPHLPKEHRTSKGGNGT